MYAANVRFISFQVFSKLAKANKKLQRLSNMVVNAGSNKIPKVVSVKIGGDHQLSGIPGNEMPSLVNRFRIWSKTHTVNCW